MSMGNPMKIRASVKDGVTEVKVLMQHEMETGLRKDADGKLVPAWHISDVKAQHNGKTVLEAQFGTAVSKNPYLVFHFKGGKPGEIISVNWVDNKGDTRTDEAEIS
jgi:sulfur-oxidizing protein SoxZ